MASISKKEITELVEKLHDIEQSLNIPSKEEALELLTSNKGKY